MVLAVIVYVWLRASNTSKARFALYPNFGIELPQNYNIHGIDVSWYQGFIDWQLVKEMKDRDVSIQFTFIKATEGIENIDRQFKRNWKKAGEAGITKGAYHYFVASKSGKQQAMNFIKNVTLQAGDLPPVLDVEDLFGVKPAQMRKEVKDWLAAVEAHYKVKPIIYTYVSFYSTFLGDQFMQYPLWAAHYHERDKPRIDRTFAFWQHSEEGRVNGIVQHVDFDVFNGDSTAFAALLVN